MTEILCDWLNKDLQLSIPIDAENFEKEFSNGYLIGEVLNKYELQDDFDRFSTTMVSESKINNFTRLEPVFHLLGVPFDTNTARSVMTEEPGVATRLMYQLFIALENKKKANLTGAAMETMRPAAPAKLQSMESIIYRQRLKQVTPRQTDLNLKELVDKFHQHQAKLEERALKGRIESAEAHRRDHQEHRQRQLQRSKQMQIMQSEQMAKIQAAIVQIPAPPPNRTAAAIAARQQQRHAAEAKSSMQALDLFEEKLSRTLQPVGEEAAGRPGSSTSGPSELGEDGEAASETAAAAAAAAAATAKAKGEAMDFVKPASNDAYISKIRHRLAEDAEARAAREKRRRKVLVDCLRAHEQQEEAAREAQLAAKLVRQSQMERRIAVQLLQARREKDVLKRNRYERERQYQLRREQEFQEAMDREKRLAEEAKVQYQEQLQLERRLHEEAARERQLQRLQRHTSFCQEVVGDIVDVACRVAEFRERDGGRLPRRKYRDLAAVFVSGQPLYESRIESLPASEAVDDEVGEGKEGPEFDAVATDLRDPLAVAEETMAVQDEGELLEYKDMLGEWQPPEECEVREAPMPNPVIGWIVDRIHNIAHPPSPPPAAPELPPFPIKAAICGKLFSGKTSVIRSLVENNRCVSFRVSSLAEEAMEAFKQDERVSVPTPPPLTPPGTPLQSERPEGADSQVIQEAAAESPAGGEAQQQPTTASQSQVAESAADAESQSTMQQQQQQQQQKQQQQQPPPEPQLTRRAKVGKQLAALLKRGKPMPDDVIVELLMEAISRVPEGTGWILDGFPSTYQQAKLFEKALTGFEEPTKASKKKERKSQLTSNPKPAPPPPEPTSGLDLVINFSIDDSWCLKRALGRVEQRQAGEKFHYEFKQPPQGSATGLQGAEPVTPVADPAHDLEQVQKRLTSFSESWPKLEKFYQRFGNTRSVDASLEPEALYLEVEHILDDFVAKRLEEQRLKEEEEARAAAEALLAEQRRLELEEEQRRAAEAAAAEEAASQAAAEASATAAAAVAAGEGKRSRPGSKRGRGRSAKASPARSKSKSASRASSAEKQKGAKSPRQEKKSKSPRGASPKSPKGRKAKSPDSSKDSKEARGSQEKEAAADVDAQEQPPPPPTPKPGEPDWEFVDLPIPEELACALSPLWDGIEQGYVLNVKSVFRRLRQLKDSAVLYFYETRRDFLEYLERPDNKQTYVTSFQQDFNSFQPDLRQDEEVIAELHQRFEQLRESLIDMTDRRKEQAETKKQEIEGNGWVEDRLGLMTNLYIELLQSEMDRFQDSVRFMKDYYKAMDTPIPDHFRPEFVRLPIMQLPYEKEPGNSGEGSRASSRHQSPVKAASPVGKKGKKEQPDEARELTDEEIEAMFHTKVPTVGQSPTLAEFKEALQAQVKAPKDKGAKKDKKTERIETPAAPSDADAKVVFDAFWAGVTQILHFVNQELALKEAEEEAERQRLLEKEKEREKAAKEAAKGGGKKGGKKGKSRSPSPKKGAKGGAPKAGAAAEKSEEASATPDPMSEPLETDEEKAKREAREKMREEYFFSLEREAQAARARMQLCVAISAKVLQDLKEKREDMSKDLLDWIGARLLHESELIDQVSEVIRYAIETRQPIVERLELSATDFLINSEFKVIPEVPPPERPPPIEQLEADWFSLKSINQFLESFRNVAPEGLLTINEFVSVILEIVQSHQDPDLLPAAWQQCSSKHIEDMAEALSADQEYVSWRSFLLSIAQPWPWPSQQQLLDSLAKFKDVDQLESGKVTREQYDFIELWFSGGSPPPTPPEPTQPKVISRLEGFKRLLFDIFADQDGRMPYQDLLLHCAASKSPYVGFLKALSVTNDSHIPHIAIAGYEAVTGVDPQAEEVPEDCEDSLVNIEALYKVLGYARHITEDTTDFTDLVDTEVTQECLTKPMLGAIYHQLGSDDMQPLPFTKLVKHVNLVELMLQATQYKQVQIRDLLPPEPRSSRAASATTGQA